MSRRLLNLLAILSLLLFVGVIVFGIWGYREGPREIRLEWVGKHHCLALLSDRGAIAAVYSSGWPAGDWVNDRPVTVTSSSSSSRRVVGPAGALGAVAVVGGKQMMGGVDGDIADDPSMSLRS